MEMPKDIIGSGDGLRCWVFATFFGATKPEIMKKAEDYCAQYPPQGYDTHTVVPPELTKGGYWLTKLRRYSTCE